ncbi:hypothetical protein BD413DRAFT_523491 [Trametes elegans]|nr:hypothetical protein BD413DRAFT_523491 [Trametes elegans]
MPRLGSDSNSSVRRHNPTQTLSNYFQVNSQVWQIRSGGLAGNESQPASTSGASASAGAGASQSQSADPQLDVLDDLLSRTRASGSRTRWNARPSGSPYGHRPLHKWLPSEQKHFEELTALMEMFPEPASDDDYEEKDLHEIVEADEDEDGEDESDAEEDEADLAAPAPPHGQGQPPLSAAAAKKREKNKKKKAKARAKAKEKMKPTALPEPPRDPPQDLLVSMSRIAQLVGSLNTDSPDESNELLQRVRDAFTEEGRRQLGSGSPKSTEPAQWRAEVLQSVRRMESMLGQMEKWQAQVAPGEIEALRAETARLEVRVRAVVEQKERERAEVRAAVQAQQAGVIQPFLPRSKAKDEPEVEVEVAEAVVSSEGEDSVGLDGEGLFQTGAEVQEDDVGSVSDSAPESNSCPSETDTGPTEPEPDDPTLQEDKSPQADSLPTPGPPHSTTPITTAAPIPLPDDESPPNESSTPRPPSDPSTFNTPAPANQNVPPEPPADPIEHLRKNPWSMIEVLFLLEVVAHFPPTEHGWVFIAEAYNNILITRPLQEWFGKQATASNEEEAKMKAVLQKMHGEVRQLRSRRAQEAAPAAQRANGIAGAGPHKTGERGKAAPFGSAEARAEANARAKHPSSAAVDKDAIIVTRLPYPFPAANGSTHAADNPATPPPAQRIVPFPRRRPPLSLPSEDARSFTRVMASAAAAARPPTTESRTAMLALYSATKTRFPVRTAWDCWHRWCTPWVVQDGPTAVAEPELEPGRPPVVLDYIAGNVCLPAGTWIAQARGFVYRPVPGTYPDAPGVQRRVTAGYDPRPGMVAFARMAHLFAERAWAAMGLKRRPDGKVSEEVLIGRRAKLPGTLAGIWPGKGQPAKAAAKVAQAATQAQKPGANVQTAKAGVGPALQPTKATGQPAKTSAAARVITKATPAQDATPAALIPSPASAAADGPKKVRFAPLPPKALQDGQPEATTTKPPAAAVASSSSKNAPIPLSTPMPVPAVAPANAGYTIANPRPPFLPLPLPRKRPARGLPRVPEGTLGNRAHPGMAAWFEHAAVGMDVLARVTDLGEARRKFAVAVGASDGENDGEEDRGRGVPLHLRKVVVPPVPPSRSSEWAAGGEVGRLVGAGA